MRIIGNLLWVVFGGAILALLWSIAGLLLCVTVIGIPFGVQCFKIANLVLWPFGKAIDYPKFNAGSVLFNLLWILIFGWELAISAVTLGIIYCVTVVGIPFGVQCFKFAQLALFPFGGASRAVAHILGIDMGAIDLHIHSIFSDDGEHSIDSLMDLAAQAGLQVAAIADHDSVKGPRAIRATKRSTSVRWIDAIEISCRHEGRDYHLLGYFIDPFDPRFDELERRMQDREEAATERRLQLLEEHFGIAFPLDTLDEYAAGRILTGEKICAWLLENEANRKHPELASYFPNGSRSDNALVNFYWDYLAQGKVAYVPLDLPKMHDCIDMIHSMHGVAILAHPGKNVREEHLVLDELVKLGLDGLEAFSSYHNEIQIAFYAAYAKRNALILTCGSDFHGKSKPRIKLGMTHCPLTAEEIMVNLERGRK